MTNAMKPIRRVVTGNDAQGRSRVLYDGPAPNTVPRADNPRAGAIGVGHSSTFENRQRIGPLTALGDGAKSTWEIIAQTCAYIAAVFTGAETYRGRRAQTRASFASTGTTAPVTGGISACARAHSCRCAGRGTDCRRHSQHRRSGGPGVGIAAAGFTHRASTGP